MKPNSLQDLYVKELGDLYDAEQQIIKALPALIEAAQSEGLKDALTEHLDVTKEQASRLVQIFSDMGEKTKREKCKGMQGIIQEGSDLVDEIKNPDLRDAAIIASAQRVEHYEMSGYGTTRTYAELLGQNEASQLLQQTLDEEKEADQKLTDLAKELNVNAMSAERAESGKVTSSRRRKSAA
jgi:ferritin-like metal-binding protein YciE